MQTLISKSTECKGYSEPTLPKRGVEKIMAENSTSSEISALVSKIILLPLRRVGFTVISTVSTHFARRRDLLLSAQVQRRLGGFGASKLKHVILTFLIRDRHVRSLALRSSSTCVQPLIKLRRGSQSAWTFSSGYGIAPWRRLYVAPACCAQRRYCQPDAKTAKVINSPKFFARSQLNHPSTAIRPPPAHELYPPIYR